MKTIGTVLQFAQYQQSLNRTMQKYLLDSHAESEISKINARWNVLEKFESHFTHNVVVSRSNCSTCEAHPSARSRRSMIPCRSKYLLEEGLRNSADRRCFDSSATSDNPALSSLVSRLGELKKWADRNMD